MALFPSLRKTLRPSPRGLGVAPEVKWAAGGYFRDLRSAMSAASGREWTPELAVAEGYERIVWVWKPTGVIAENQAARKIRFRQGAAYVEDDPLLKLLNVRANPLETGKVFRKRLSAQILLSPKGAFVEVGKTRGGSPYRLDLLPPGRTRIVPGDPKADPRDVASLIDHIEVVEPDGLRVRTIEPEDVRWFRDPHPLDPYMGTTPLEAAGLSVELDHFARLYNVTFLKNDGRPGGIIAVNGDADPETLRDIERRFDKGPAGAGKVTAITAEGMAFIDPAGKPRDMSYAQLARNAKVELLSAFGVSESMMGYSGEKTFANAEQERLGFWQDTMPPHLSIITDGFNEDTDDEVEPEFDLDDVEVLQKLKDAKLARMREEVAAGLRSPYSYAQAAGITEVEDTIHTRSLYIASGKQPLPINDADAVTMGLGPAEEGGGRQPAAAAPQAPTEGGGPGAAEVAAGGPTGGGSPEGGVPAGPGAAQAALGAAQAANPAAPAGGAAAQLLAAAAATSATPTQGKVLLRVVGGKARQTWMSDDADEDARDQLEAAIARALDDLTEDWVERAAARLSSVKSRKHTRHWQPQGDRPVDTRVATKAIDPTYAVDDETWAEEAAESVAGLLVAAAARAAHATWSALTDEPGLPLPGRLAERVTDTADEITAWIAEGARRAAARLARAINDGDQDGLPMDDLVEGVRSYRSRLTGWARSIAVQAATAATEGARALAARTVTDPVAVYGDDAPQVIIGYEVEQRWRTRRDDKVRHTHDEAHGQKQPAGGLFEVGGYLLRWPGDPLAPPSETRNCRCWVQHRSRRTGRYVPRPADLPAVEAAR